MAGYSGFSMSNNAVAAYRSGEMPLSKWGKAEILEAIGEFSSLDFSKLTKKELQDFLYKSSWHHTSKHYNCTEFYCVDDGKVHETTETDILHIMSFRKPKEKAERKPKEKPLFVTALVEYDFWTGTKKHPKKNTAKETVRFMSNEKMVETENGTKRLSSLYILKKVEQKTRFAQTAE